MSKTHAGKMGAKGGLGLVGIQAGFYFRKFYYERGWWPSFLKKEKETKKKKEDLFFFFLFSLEIGEVFQGESEIDLEGVTLWLAYLFIFLGLSFFSFSSARSTHSKKLN
jgi:hypothetical protein